jgi:hypothetical protein
MGFKRPPQIRGLLRAGSGEVQAAQRSYKGERVEKELYIVVHCFWIWAVRVAESVEVRARRLSGWILVWARLSFSRPALCFVRVRVADSGARGRQRGRLRCGEG